jgi:hypothetical protein
MPAIRAVGVARPSAQGQAIIRTLMVVRKAKVTEGCGPNNHQVKKVIAAIASTIGTNTEAILSASF